MQDMKHFKFSVILICKVDGSVHKQFGENNKVFQLFSFPSKPMVCRQAGTSVMHGDGKLGHNNIDGDNKCQDLVRY